MVKTGERQEYDSSPRLDFPLPARPVPGVALSGQTNRQLMMKRVGGLLPGGQGLFKHIDQDSYAKGN